eukprot:194960-Chlamydomonas_euryale.AAC.8
MASRPRKRASSSLSAWCVGGRARAHMHEATLPCNAFVETLFVYPSIHPSIHPRHSSSSLSGTASPKYMVGTNAATGTLPQHTPHSHIITAPPTRWWTPPLSSKVPVVIDVLFKYWIFIGLNKISPGAVVTIKQIDTH